MVKITLKLVKGRSYSTKTTGGMITATVKAPFVDVVEADAKKLIATGYFEKVEENNTSFKSDNVTVDDLPTMTVAQLRQFAEAKGIDLGGATKKEEIVSLITAWFENN